MTRKKKLIEVALALDNKPDDFVLAIVEFTGDDSHRVHHIRRPFGREPDFGVTRVNYAFGARLARADQTW